MSAKQRKRKPLSGRFAVFFTILLFVCTVIFLNNRFASGSLRRISYWIFNGVRGDATEATINFDANEYNKFAVLKGNLCVISPEKLSVYKLSGKELLSEPVLLRSPAVSTSDSRFIAYDLGGLNYYIANNRELLFSGTCDSQILNANMNKSGDVAIVTDSDDCKSLVTVYDSHFEAIYKFHSSEKYVFDAAVSPNGKTVAIASYGTEEGIFESTLLLGKTNSDSFYNEIPLGDSIPLKVTYHTDSKILVICNDKTVLYNSDGTLFSEISYGELPLRSFSESKGKHIGLLLDNYQNGGNSRLVIINSNGESRILDFDEDVYSISCSGLLTSVQFSDKCSVYKNDLSLHSEFMIPTSISRCITNSDGSVLSVGENFATLYIE